MSRAVRLLMRLGLLALLIVALVLAGAWALLSGGLAQLEGATTVPGLSAPVEVTRDVLGVVTVNAGNPIDAARALGYVHAQERFFEMDLLRRAAAGELSELFGAIAVDRDKAIRIHRLRSRVRANLAAIAGDQQPALEAYTAGVNAGLAGLRVKPWPYWLLRTTPMAWRAEDTALVGYAMFFDLQDESNSRELALWKIRGVVPEALYRMIAADGSTWDAPLKGNARSALALPSADLLDLRTMPVPALPETSTDSEPAAPGSNNFAVSGALTDDGRAIVANDMHLGLRVPNIWFRARLVYPDSQAPSGQVDVSGFTLPGIPAVVVGSNRHVAWGFTNAYGDWLDFHEVAWADAAHTKYRTATGERTVVVHPETIRVKGAASIPFPVRETLWGPVAEKLDGTRSLALQWTAHLPGAINLGLAELTRAERVDQALGVAGRIGMPAQNLVIADREGRIAWRLTGQIPKRTGPCDAPAPMPSDLNCEWSGWQAPSTSPALVNPPSGRLWTANARTVDGAELALVGDGGYAHGSRARQIRDALFSRQRFDEKALLAIQLDDRAILLQRWWRLMRRQANDSRDPAWQELADEIRQPPLRAVPDSISYGVVRDWRLAVLARIKDGLLAPAHAALGSQFIAPDLPQLEGVAWQLVMQRPTHLLPRRFASWDALLKDAAIEVSQTRRSTGQRDWGDRNRARICHPLAGALPTLAKRWLCMPTDALAGDLHMPRVSAPSFGASQRMVVAPGQEQRGIIHMPGGQSGNPLSPFWGAGHVAWVRGAPTPFLPGEAKYRLQMSGQAN